MCAWALVWGNGYAEIERNRRGEPVWLWPIMPDRVSPDRQESGELGYWVQQASGAKAWIAARNMFHVHGLGFDGLTGYSVVTQAAKTVATGVAMEQFQSSFYENGTRLSGIIKYKGKMKPESVDQARKDFERIYKGANKGWKVGILEEGWDWQQLGMPLADAEFVLSRKLNVIDICRWFRVPPHKVMDLERATYSNIEHQAIEFVTDTVVPWVTRFEQEANSKLFGAQQRGVFYSKLNVNALLRGDLKSRYDAYSIGRRGGWLSVNDVRRREDENGIGAEGDIYLAPMDSIPAGLFDEYSQAKIDSLNKGDGAGNPGSPPAPNQEAQQRALRRVAAFTADRIRQRERRGFEAIEKKKAEDKVRAVEQFVSTHLAFVREQCAQALYVGLGILSAGVEAESQVGRVSENYAQARCERLRKLFASTGWLIESETDEVSMQLLSGVMCLGESK
jgi:HK97 family phage portal protein